MKYKSLILGVVGSVVLSVAVGIISYQTGYAQGNQQAQNLRLEFFRDRLNLQGQTAQTDGSTPRGGAPGALGPGQRGGGALTNPGTGGPGRVAVNGVVKSVRGNKIEVTANDGNVVTVTVESQTQVVKTMAGQVSEIQPGMRVAVTSEQTGNNVTARLITIQQRPE